MGESPKLALRKHSADYAAWKARVHKALAGARRRWTGDVGDFLAVLVAVGSIETPQGYSADEFLRERSHAKCKHCGRDVAYFWEFDALFCKTCLKWQTEKCDHTHCPLCEPRPENPVGLI